MSIFKFSKKVSKKIVKSLNYKNYISFNYIMFSIFGYSDSKFNNANMTYVKVLKDNNKKINDYYVKKNGNLDSITNPDPNIKTAIKFMHLLHSHEDAVKKTPEDVLKSIPNKLELFEMFKSSEDKRGNNEPLVEHPPIKMLSPKNVVGEPHMIQHITNPEITGDTKAPAPAPASIPPNPPNPPNPIAVDTKEPSEPKQTGGGKNKKNKTHKKSPSKDQTPYSKSKQQRKSKRNKK